jgi:hypothetical protein
MIKTKLRNTIYAHCLKYQINPKKYEWIFLQDPLLSYLYIKSIIRSPWKNSLWKLGERTISKDPYYSYKYARYVLNSRFPLGEPTIAKDYHSRIRYERYFNCKL